MAGDTFSKVGRGIGDIAKGIFTAPQVAERAPHQFQWGDFQQNRGNMQNLANQYALMASGQGPSLAQGQLQQATDQNISNAMALGAAQQGQGLGYASALRNIADQSAAARQQQAAQSAMIRNYEQMQGMQGQGALYGQMGGMDLQRQGMEGQNALGYDTLNAGIATGNANRPSPAGQFLNSIGGSLPTLFGLGKQALQSGGGQPPLGPGAWDPNMVPMLSSGGYVPGYAHGGRLDSTSNDTVPTMLSPGEIVLPRSVTLAPDAPERSRAFVAAIRAHRSTLKGPDTHPILVDMDRKRRKAA